MVTPLKELCIQEYFVGDQVITHFVPAVYWYSLSRHHMPLVDFREGKKALHDA